MDAATYGSSKNASDTSTVGYGRVRGLLNHGRCRQVCHRFPRQRMRMVDGYARLGLKRDPGIEKSQIPSPQLVHTGSTVRLDATKRVRAKLRSKNLQVIIPNHTFPNWSPHKHSYTNEPALKALSHQAERRIRMRWHGKAAYPGCHCQSVM